MSRMLATVSLMAVFADGTALADVPRVAVDIAPVHSLVAQVMADVGAPDLIVQPGASPHEYALRPSEASALQDADLVFWIGPNLTPWLADAMGTLADDAGVTALLDTDGTIRLEFREGALFEKHSHAGEGDHGHEHAEAHDHDHGDHKHDHKHDHAEAQGHYDAHNHDHDDHTHDHDHDDHAQDQDQDHGHSHTRFDGHAWLSPANAANWLNVIASQLSVADPDNAGTYFANAAAARAEIDALSADVTAMLDPLRDTRFIVFHDAYQYFETDFDFPAAGAISLSDASDPSPARIAEIQARIAEEGIDCVLAEPQFNPGLIATVLAGTEAGTGVADPLGVGLEPGPALYGQLIRDLASSFEACL